MQGLEESLSLDFDYFHRVACLAQCQGSAVAHLLVSAVNGNEVVVAAAGYFQCYLGAVVYHHRARVQAVRCNGCQDKDICVGGNDGASCTQ